MMTCESCITCIGEGNWVFVNEPFASHEDAILFGVGEAEVFSFGQ